MTKQLTKWQRIEAAIHGAEVDRVPLSLWKHYHLQDRSPRQLTHATLSLHRQFDTDLIKLTPSGLYSVQDWGGTIRFGQDDDTAPVVVEPAITSAEQWPALPRLAVTKGALGRELEFIHQVANELKGAVPFVMTLFSPLTTAYKLRGEQLFTDLRQAPHQLHAGLKVIREVLIEYATASLEAGASGFFFATQVASYDKLTRSEYEEFGRAYDLDVLASFQNKSRVTLLHLCRGNLMFDLLADYPVHLLNWADRATGPSLVEARRLTQTTLAGGLSLETLHHGSPEEVLAEARLSIAQAGRTGFILAPACVIPGSTPDANLAAVRQAILETTR